MTPQSQQSLFDLAQGYRALAQNDPNEWIPPKQIADELTKIELEFKSCPAPSAEPKFSSTDLILLANDEWKRREERKHNHENAPWCAGFINGFLTDKKWARERIDKIQKDAEDKLRSPEAQQ